MMFIIVLHISASTAERAPVSRAYFENLDRELEAAKRRDNLSLIEVKCAIGSREDLGRPTTTALENKQNFMEYISTL